MKKLTVAVIIIIFLFTMHGCTTSKYNMREESMGSKTIDIKPVWIESKVSVINEDPQKLLIRVSHRVSNKGNVETVRTTYDKRTNYYFMPITSHELFCPDKDNRFPAGLLVIMAPIDLLFLSLFSVISGTPMPCVTENRTERIVKTPVPMHSQAYTEPAAGSTIEVEIPEFKFSQRVKANSEGVITLSLVNNLPDEAISANLRLKISDKYGDHTVEHVFFKDFITKLLNKDPKRMYAFGPPTISAKVGFHELSGNNILDAGEKGKLIVTITNTGKGDAFEVAVEIAADTTIPGLEFKNHTFIGTVPAGKSVTQEIPLTAKENIQGAEARFTVSVKEHGGFDAEPLKIAFRTKEYQSPKLIVADFGIDDQNKNNKIEQMELVELTARVQNVGKGTARTVIADIITGENVFIAEGSQRHFEIGDLIPGAYKDIKFVFYSNKRIMNGANIPVSVKMTEASMKHGADKPLDLVMNAPQKNITSIVVAGKDAKDDPITVADGLSVDVDINVPSGSGAGPDDVAVLIGNQNYTQKNIPSVEFARHDAAVMREYLVKTFGYKPSNIIYIEDATVGKFNELFGTEQNHKGRLFRYLKPGISSVYIYYTGHGAPDIDSQEAYFVPVDADPQYIATNGYKLKTFYNNLTKLPAKKITVVIDACFSGNTEKGFLFNNISPALVKLKKEVAGPQNAVVITSANIDQVSSWYPEKKHSLFTYFFLKGISGQADGNNDKKIMVKELREYLQKEIPYMAQRLSGVEQQPMITGDDNDILVVLSR